MAELAAAKPLRALLRMLTSAPSLIERPNKSRGAYSESCWPGHCQLRF
jgi:hypothetical protein